MIAHFADEYDVGILSQRAAESFGKGTCIDVDLTLGQERLLIAMQELNRILDGHDVPAARRVDAIDHRRQGRGLPRAGGACNQDQPASFLRNLFDYWRQTELCGSLCSIGNDAKHNAYGTALLKNVCAKTSQARYAVADIYFRHLLEALLLSIGHDRERHVQSIFRLQTGSVGDRVKFTADTHNRERPHLEVEVGSVMTASNAKQIVDF